MDDLKKQLDILMAKVDKSDAKLDKMMQLVNRVSALEDTAAKLGEKAENAASRVDAIESQNVKTNKRIEALEGSHNRLKKKVNEDSDAKKQQDLVTERMLSDFAETCTRLRNLRINGIPAVKGERLAEIVSKVFHLVGLELHDAIRFYRLRTGSSLDTIIVNFPSEYDKDNFLERYRSAAPKFMVSAIMPAAKENNIFVSPDLCQTQYKICREVQKLRGNIVKKFRVIQGFVNIQLEEDKPFIRILSLEMLHSLTESASKNLPELNNNNKNKHKSTN